MTPWAVGAVAVADFLDRVRRPAFVAVLVTAVGLGYCAAPPGESPWMIFRMGDYRGVYTSEFLGPVTALAAGAWLTLIGFYFVKNTVTRDDTTGVGQVLAATRVRSTAYLLGKFVSNLMLLTAMAAVLALTALGMQLLRGESSSVNLGALWLPFLVLTFPMLALPAATAVVFETVKLLRGGVGNIVWFFLWILVVGPGAAGVAALDALGLNLVVPGMRADINRQFADPGDTGESIGLNFSAPPAKRFVASGLDVTAPALVGRLLFVAVAAALVVLAALWFRRFDPARAGRLVTHVVPADVSTPPAPTAAMGSGPTRPTSAVGRGSTAIPLFTGELRILMRGTSRWWWLVLLATAVTGCVVPLDVVTGFVLPALWILPMLLWSRMGTQRHEHDVHLLVGSSPARRSRLAAEWAAGLTLAFVAGAVPLARMLIVADWLGTLAWLGGLVFIPSLSLALGTLARSHRLFQIVYLLLWYGVISRGPLFDYMGAVRTDGHPAGPSPLLYATIAAALLVTTIITEEIRHASR